MEIISIINTFLLPAITAILAIGIALNIRHTERNIYRNYLTSMLFAWALILTIMYVKYHIDGKPIIAYHEDIASIKVLLLGAPFCTSLIMYPIIVLNANRLMFKNWVLTFAPFAAVIALYFGWHWATGNDPFVGYKSYSEFANNIFSISVMLRLLMMFTFGLYSFIFLRRIWMTVPIYNKYIEENIADSDYNVNWIKTLVKYLAVASLFHVGVLIHCTPLINMLYLISILILFSHIIEVSLFSRILEDIEPIKIKRDFRSGKFYVEEEEAHSEEKPQSNLIDIDKWMKRKSPYTNIDFTTKDIIENFPDLTQFDLTLLFKSRDETFQSYARRYRIMKACDIIIDNKDKIYPKLIFEKVGFSHYSSFSRSFAMVVGVSPSEFIKLSEEEQIVLRDLLENTNENSMTAE